MEVRAVYLRFMQRSHHPSYHNTRGGQATRQKQHMGPPSPVACLLFTTWHRHSRICKASTLQSLRTRGGGSQGLPTAAGRKHRPGTHGFPDGSFKVPRSVTTD